MSQEHMPISQPDADEEIFNCIDLENSKSFFLFAGAGSGKTRSLVITLRRIRETIGLVLRFSRKKVAVITYTNGASNEIKQRLELDPLFAVSTIHHFVWELIKPYTVDIKNVLKSMLEDDLTLLGDQQSKGRSGTKAATEREIAIRQKVNRLKNLATIKQFQYSPTSDNSSRDSLNHSEVIDLAGNFLTNKPLLQKLLVTRYPILFIDESQDTNKRLIDALFLVQSQYPQTFTLGLFGDTMQRIYFDGKPDLGLTLPKGWKGPVKIINHRCPIRVVKLINQIRSLADGREQQPREGQVEGFVRLFIVKRGSVSPKVVEEKISAMMRDITKDELWTGKGTEIKILTLEHHMAASRMGFLDFFTSLSTVSSQRTLLIDGTFPGVSFFTKIIIPLISAKEKNDSFGIMRILKGNSPLLKSENIKNYSDQREPYQKAKIALDALFLLWNKDVPTLQMITKTVYDTNLFELPAVLSLIMESQNNSLKSIETDIKTENIETDLEDENETPRNENVVAWEQALNCHFTEIEEYGKYIEDSSRFGTHQGVKGREFDRVMVIADDFEARGFSFSYDRLFGATPAGDTERRNIAEGRETIFDRTLRLFYVACSRAEKSLAIVAYTDSPSNIKKNALEQKWFSDEEIIEFEN